MRKLLDEGAQRLLANGANHIQCPVRKQLDRAIALERLHHTEVSVLWLKTEILAIIIKSLPCELNMLDSFLTD